MDIIRAPGKYRAENMRIAMHTASVIVWFSEVHRQLIEERTTYTIHVHVHVVSITYIMNIII